MVKALEGDWRKEHLFVPGATWNNWWWSTVLPTYAGRTVQTSTAQLSIERARLLDARPIHTVDPMKVAAGKINQSAGTVVPYWLRELPRSPVLHCSS